MRSGNKALATDYSRNYIPEEKENEIWLEWEKEEEYWKEVEAKWRETLPTAEQRSEIFGLPSEQIMSMRQRYLKGEFERLIRQFHEEGKQEMSDDILKIIGEYKRKYEKVDSISESDIIRARETAMEKFIEVRKGFSRCPFHQEKTPSFHVKDNLFFCFGCGKGGDTITFVMEKFGLSFKEAIKYINDLQ